MIYTETPSHLAAHAHGLVPGVGHEVAVDGDGLAVVLVRPARVVAVGLHAQPDVGHEGHHVGLPIVQRLEGGEVSLRGGSRFMFHVGEKLNVSPHRISLNEVSEFIE